MEAITTLSALNECLVAALNTPPPAPSTGEALVEGVVSNIVNWVATAGRRIELTMRALLFWAPALASMLLVWAGLRWPSFGNSPLWNGVVAIPLAYGAVLALALFLFVTRSVVPGVDEDALAYGCLYMSYGFAAIALALQVAARSSFSIGRATGIAVALFTLPVSFIIGQQIQ